MIFLLLTPPPPFPAPPTAAVQENLLDEYEYGMCGKVFKYEYLSDPPRHVGVVASFGGLLMLLQGEQRNLIRIQLDQKVYALIRKID